MLGTENYGTSFQSLMSPMYNVSANYSMNGYGMGAGYGLGYGGYMGGMMTPMANVGVGQFNADYLIKDDSKNNNYYVRPVAAHKKKDETGTILGIGAAALATVALIAAACKGKRGTIPAGTTTGTTGGTTGIIPAGTTTGTTGGATGIIPAGTTTGTTGGATGTIPAGYVPFTEITASNTGRVAGLLPANTNNVAGLLPANTNNVVGLLPAKPSAQLNLGSVTTYLRQGRNGITLPEERIAGFLPSSQTVGTQRNAVLNLQRQGVAAGHGLRYNRHPQVTGDVLRAEFGKIGLNIDTKAFAKLSGKEQRMINNLVMNGTQGELQALTCNPQYEHLFSLL